MTEAIVNLKFQRQPSPVLAEHRPLYKIFQVLLVLHVASRGGRSSLPRLHLFNWALKTPERSQHLVKASQERVLRVAAWGFDPALAIAIRYAIAENMIREVSTGYELTEHGSMLALEIKMDPNIFTKEKLTLAIISKGITEAMVDTVAKGWEVT